MNSVVLSLLCFLICTSSGSPLDIPTHSYFGHYLNSPLARVKGGQDAERYQFPYQALIQSGGNYLCEGGLISEEYVITGSKCVKLANTASRVRVVLGALDVDQHESDVEIRNISEFITHPNNDDDCLRFNIGLLRLDKPVNYTKAIQPVKLIEGNQCEIVGNVTLSGWGLITGDMLPSILQWVNLLAITNEDCKKLLPSSITLTSHVMCTIGSEEEFQGSTYDIAAPLILQSTKELVGLAIGSGCCAEVNPKKPTIYTNVCTFHKWIRDETGL